MLHTYLLTISAGFLCNFLATILPFWFARYPSAKARFLCLGLWEICLEDFISPLDQQRLYNGCFYIFDSKIRPLRPFFFATWLHVAQALQILSMIAHAALVGNGFGMLFNVFDKHSPRIVFTSICLLVLNCWVLLTQLGVVGVNLDLEKKQAEISGASMWISEADQSCLSWSFGLSAFVLFFVLIALNILVWERGGRLLTQAWTWPTIRDLPCCLARNSVHRRGALQEAQRAGSLSTRQQIELTQPHHQTADPSRDTDLSSLDVATYDPRSADVVSRENMNESAPISATEISAAGVKLDEYVKYEKGAALYQPDPRTSIDVNFSRVSSRMSSVRSSIRQGSSGFVRARNRTYIIKKGQNQPLQQTVIRIASQKLTKLFKEGDQVSVFRVVMNPLEIAGIRIPYASVVSTKMRFKEIANATMLRVTIVKR
ncbi:hypothetical protein EGR_08020 [Echinococcus granulosus]|uniref:Uncharacterized protein n=1 Tax=Echinococcus granulosus TaxID=6210 RepID=W6U9E5_ECHGR|nr:hypothetical protein EGR_08020 [Echinococcus granulosus]EUB57136.1 hypothetical protein EGR_08020 [Echinococcus granulosus]